MCIIIEGIENGYSKLYLFLFREKEEQEVNAAYYSKLHNMLPLCDFVITICPLTPETEKLFGEKEFSIMKNSATIINIARG